MAGTRAAIRYAKALLELALSKNTADAVNDDMVTIRESIHASEDLNNLIQSAVIKSNDKKAALLKVFTKANPLFSNLLDVLVTNKRVQLLEPIASQFIALYKAHQGIEEAIVTTAVPLTKTLEAQILTKVASLTSSKNISIKNNIDESIIGGFVLRVGDQQYDASITNQLNTLKREFTLN